MWFYIALATSLISAVSIVFNKKILRGVSPYVLTWCTLLLATPIIAIFAMREGIPSLNKLFFIGVVGSVLFYAISTIIQFRAMKIADLSAIYPLVCLGPVFTLLAAFFPPLNEELGFIAIIGILVTLSGTYILNVSNAKEGLLKPIKLLFKNKASALMIFSVLIGSVVVVFDKLAINNTLPKNTTFVLLVENILVIIGLLPILFLRNKNFVREIFDNKKLFIVLGVLNAFSTILAFLAVGGGSVGIVSTILKVQLLFVLLFSFLFFKDKPKLETIIGSLIMILGVVLIKIGLGS
jgi:uncharacterized membrane protein